MKLYKNETGFTLIEILIVVLIIGIIAALAIPNLLSAQKTALAKTCAANRSTLASAAELYKIQKGSYPSKTSDLWTGVAAPGGGTYDPVMTRPMDSPAVPVTSTSKGDEYTIDTDDGTVTCKQMTAGKHS